MTYLCEIIPEGRGRFRAIVHGTNIMASGIDPQHGICRALLRAGYPDGPIEFIQAGMTCMRGASIASLAKFRVGEDLRRRKFDPFATAGRAFGKISTSTPPGPSSCS